MALWRKRAQIPAEVENLISISDPALAAYFGITPSFAGVNVGELSALGVSSVWRAVSLISGTIASLPIKTFRDTADGERQRVTSVLDDPGAVIGMTPYEWKQTVVLHLLLHGRAPLAHIRNQGGMLIGLMPVHPLAAPADPPRYDSDGKLMPKTFTVSLRGAQARTFTEGVDMTEILGMSLDGWNGLSVISVARNSLGTTIAGDRAAARMFSSGMLIQGLVTPEEDMPEEDAIQIKAGLDRKLSGWEHAGELAFVNRKLRFSPWTMSMEDAQFIQSRQFQIEEVARWFGIPPFELMQTEKQTSWGTGIEAQQRGLARGNLLGWTMRIEQKLSRLIAAQLFGEFDFAALERPTPELEIRLLIEQVNAGLLTVNEARKIRNLPPLPGGDVPRDAASPPAQVEEMV